MYLNTVEQVRIYMNSIKSDQQNPISDDQLKWFNCWYQAGLFSDLTRKDIASFLQDGCESYYSLESFQQTLDTIFDEDDDECYSDQNDLLKQQIAQFLGVK